MSYCRYDDSPWCPEGTCAECDRGREIFDADSAKNKAWRAWEARARAEFEDWWAKGKR